MNKSGGKDWDNERFLFSNYYLKTLTMKRFNKEMTKRILLTICIVFFSIIGFAKNYYVSSSGNDSNSGLTTELAWQTLAKVNAATFASGDQILFKRGDVFLGSLTVQRSGISYGAYGTGNNPIISGFETISGWTDQGDGIYRATTTATASCNMVTVNGVNTPKGRYPKTGWLTFESFSGRTSITDNQLTNTPNWTGAEVVIKKNNWTIDRSLITNHTNSTITYTSGSTFNPASVEGAYSYFIQNDIKTLTALGDWYCDGTFLYMYFGAASPSSYTIRASIVDTIITINSRNTITISGLTIEGGNIYGLYAYLSATINITNSTFRLNGYTGIFGNSNNTIIIDACNVINGNGSGINIISTAVTLKNSIIDSNGMVAGMGGTDGNGYSAVTIRSTGGLIEYNKISNSGYNGVMFYNSNFIVRFNEVYNTNSLITDGAAIYTFVGDPSSISSGQKIYYNIVHDCNANGLYLDNSVNNVEMYNNTVVNVGKAGFHINDGFDNYLHDNTFYNFKSGGMSLQNLYMLDGYCHDNTISNNIVAQGINTAKMISLGDAHTNNIINFGTSNNNTFIAESSGLNLINVQVVQPSYSMTYYTFPNWKTYSGKELNSTLLTANLSDIQVPYNETNTPKTVSLNTPMIDVKGTKYTSSITLQPFTSVVLMKDNNPTKYFIEYKSICEGTNYNGWNITGTYDRTLKTKSGSDSIVTTVLTVNPKYSISEDVTINSGETYLGWTTSGKYTRNLISVSGCDSIVITNLTVVNTTVKQGSIAPSHFIPVWNGENGLNHMNLMVVSATIEDIPISANDEIAVFSGSLCVGSAKLALGINPDDLNTYLSISASQNDGSTNGFTDNDTIIFKIWDHQNQKEMIAKAVKYRNDISGWLTNGKYVAGGTSVIEIVSYTEYTQSISLVKGYNMISTYLESNDANVSSLTKTLVDSGSLVKVQDETGNSYENWGTFGGWINNVGSVQKTEGYKIKVANNCTLQIAGRPIALPLDINLKAGWNIISFPRTDMIDALSIIQPLIDENKLVKVQDEKGNSIEDWGIYGGWKNGIGNFIPGRAYKIKMSADAVITIHENYTKSAVIVAQVAETEHFFSNVEGNGSDHMNINLVELKESGICVGDELAAFDGDICVGALKLTEKDIYQNSVSIVVSLSTEESQPNGFQPGNKIRLFSWNNLSGKESEIQVESIIGQLYFEKNASMFARLKSASTETSNLYSSLVTTKVYPNPSKGKVIISFSGMPDLGSRIEVQDMSGRRIYSRQISGLTEEINLEQQPAGIYFVKTVFGSKEEVHKLILN